ncbi:exopolygalacturonase-like [Pistacia vera]|uniref:exopolygalacturonase-like n=1 Tax=Pistacia vera TaxID=55513 RepID=UPI001263AD3F|nr:exopolygalacturonase-like [Pistacia vera]
MEQVPYANVIGSIMYAMISTRPDLSFSMSLLSRFMSNPRSEHWSALKWVLRYINGTSHIGLEYCKRYNSLDLVGFVDSDFAGDKDTRKSTTAYVFTLGGNCVSWKSQLQPIVALSSTEAEYVAIADVVPSGLERLGQVISRDFCQVCVSEFLIDLWKGEPRVFFLIFLFARATNAQEERRIKIFDVRKYGAVADGRTDNTKAFREAWDDACKWQEGKARVYVPIGTFYLNSVTLTGPCKNAIQFLIKGTLKSLNNLRFMESDRWITSRHANRLVVTGGGILDGQGSSAWTRNSCREGSSNCGEFPVSIRFEFITNSKVNDITSLDSKTNHFLMFGCSNINISNVVISAPGDSPNTDGIKIGSSNRIKISRTQIGTGDDCVSILSGSSYIDICDVFCGPGHGISVGSLGKYPNEENVYGLTVKNCTFSRTRNGVRIKTWGSSFASIAAGFTFENIFMNNVENPIIIDQQYCPEPNCLQVPSHVQIKDITYKNIWGVSSTKVAVKFECSKSSPCKNVALTDINLSYNGVDDVTISECSNVNGASYGRHSPPSCV